MRIIFWLCLVILSGCATTIDDYRNTKPNLNLREFFNGDIKAWGQFQDRSGKVIKHFTVDMKASWKNNEGILHEDFLYDDGTKQTRIWYLTDLGDGNYQGRADDVVGTAKGVARGNALQWQYTLALPVDGKVWNVQFNDWMFLHDANSMMNRATMSKFGVTLGEVTLFFRKGQ